MGRCSIGLNSHEGMVYNENTWEWEFPRPRNGPEAADIVRAFFEHARPSPSGPVYVTDADINARLQEFLEITRKLLHSKNAV